MIQGLAAYPCLLQLVNVQIAAWPEHERYLTKSFADRTPEVMHASELGAGLVAKLADHSDRGLRGLCEDYRWVCEHMILEEELHFRRYGEYRLKTFKDANEQYYSKTELMKRYMNGLLLSNLFWVNHANALAYYLSDFLPRNPAGYAHLEVGPGHGLLIYFAARDPRSGAVTGWDVSEGSIISTRRALETIGITDQVTLVCQDVFDARDARPIYDSIVISEVLEHLENPLQALRSLRQWMRPGARIWVNMPLNSPAPDHLYLLRKPDEMLDLLTKAGLDIERHLAFPMTGATLERANRQKLTINVAAVGRLIA